MTHNQVIQPTENSVQDSLDHLFRHHSGQMVSVLSRIFGLRHLDMIEDAVQESLIAALKNWPFNGVPGNPKAWLIETARNRMLDRLRRAARFREISIEAENFDIAGAGENAAQFSNEISEDQLRMIFVCCHPVIPPDSQVALTLKVVGGFSAGEIARAFLAKENSVAKMITRAKQKLRANNIELEMPPAGEVARRLDTVAKVLYLVFNEGYAASEGTKLVRHDLCFEAIRLAQFLAAHPLTGTPKIDALAALFLFQGARLASRYDQDGELLILADQDRALWDKELIARALTYFRRSAAGSELSDYHLEAEIAAVYALSPGYDSIDWPRILECYELLQQRKFSPVVELNRIIVLAKIYDSARGLKELEKLGDKLAGTNLFHITRAHFLAETGEFAFAVDAYKKAITLTHNEPVKRFLQKKIDGMSQPESRFPASIR